MINLPCPCCRATMTVEQPLRAIEIAAGDSLSPAEKELAGLVLHKGPLSLDELSALPRAHIQKKNDIISPAFIRRAAASVNKKLEDHPDLVMQVSGKVEGYSTDNPLIMFFPYPGSAWDFLEAMAAHVAQRDAIIAAEPQSPPEQEPPEEIDSAADTSDQFGLSLQEPPEEFQD